MLDRVHKISEIIGAIALVASLIFVGIQINQNTRAVRAQEDSFNWLPWLNVSEMVVSSSDFADILHRGQLGGHASLSEGEKIRFDAYISATFIMIEQNFRAWTLNPDLMTEATTRGHVDSLIQQSEGVDNQGSREWWAKDSKNGFRFEPAFLAWAEP
jgi:hypothetical protein